MIKKHIGVFRQVSLAATDKKVAEAQIDTDARAASLEGYWKFFASHVWDVQARGYVMKGTDNPHARNFAKNDIFTYMSDHDMEGFDPNYLNVRGGHSTVRCGEAQLGRKRSVVFINPICPSYKTLPHEIGHNFGCLHAGALRGTRLSKMGDHSSIMSSTTSMRGLNSPHMVMMGLADVHTIHSTEQVLLTPTELSPRSLRENERQHVRVGTYYLSLRKTKGCQYPSGESDRKKLYITRREKDESTTRILALSPRDSRKLPNGSLVEYLEYSDETARVNIHRSGGEPVDLPMPTGFAPAPDNITAERAGAYWHPDYIGQGFHILHDAGKTVIYWYTFNEFDNSRRFYIATGTGNEFDLLTMIGGTWADPTKAEPQKAGTCQLYFDGDTAVFSYNTIEHGRGSIELTEHELAAGEAWYQRSRTGEGFSLLRYGDMTVIYWYSYGPKPLSAIGSTAVRTQRWYVCSGTDDDLIIQEILDGKWQNNTKTNMTVVGSASITPDGDRLIFKYDINADRVKGEGEYILESLFRVGLVL